MKLFDRIKAATSFVFRPSANYGYGGGTSGYSGSRGPGYRSGGSKFYNGISHSGGTITLNHTETRNNARVAIQDSPTAKAMVDRRADTVAGQGLKLESMPLWEILGITEDEAEKWSSNVEKRWSLFAGNKKQNRSQSMTFDSSHSMYQKGDERDGENFIRLYYSKKAGLVSPLQFEFIDPSQIRGDAYTNTGIPNRYEDGIIRDSEGVEVGYKIWYNNKDGGYEQATIPRFGEKSKRLFMIHGFVQDLPGQSRGYSKIGHILQEFQQVTSFSLAQIEKAINQSQFVFFTKNNTQDPSNPLEDLPKGKGTFFNTGGVGGGEGDITLDPTAAEVAFCSPDEGISRRPGATIIGNMIQGDDFQAVPQTAPSIGYAEFVDSFTSTLAASRGMPLEILMMKFQNNYSASRAALVLFWMVANNRRKEMIDDYLNPVYEMWLSEEIAAGRINAPGWSDPIKRGAWLNAEWYGSPMPNINPAQEAKANKDNLEIQATTIDRVARDTNGSNGHSNMAKNKRSFSQIPVPPWGQNAGKDADNSEDE